MMLNCLIPSAAVPLMASNPQSTNNADERADALLKQMTLEEKLQYIGGAGFDIKPIERLGIPKIVMSDGPMGCRCFGEAAAFPAGIALAASWNPELADEVGKALGRECRARGVHILLAPGVNIYRAPHCGRNFEYLGEDPFLASEMVVPLIQGVQSQEVLATVKHYACNNQEWDRHNISSEVDERTLHEIYLVAFKAAIQRGNSRCLMTSYNLLNGIHCSQHSYLINTILKEQWKFDGIVMSDWTSTYDAVGVANGGLDLEMPEGAFMNPDNLLPAVEDGRVEESTIDEKVRRILRTIIAAGFFDRPQTLSDIPKDDPESDKVALKGARESIVLVKNEGNALPLKREKIQAIAVTGPNADPAIYCAGGSAFVDVFHSTSILDGLREAAGDAVDVKYIETEQVTADAVKDVNAVVYCAGFNKDTEGEGADRPFELPADQMAAIKTLGQAHSRVIVVINSGGGVAWEGWLDSVEAVLMAWYPGQMVGKAVADIIFGDINPSGKLPATFEQRWADNPTSKYYHINDDGKTPYTEGIFVGYRVYEKN